MARICHVSVQGSGEGGPLVRVPVVLAKRDEARSSLMPRSRYRKAAAAGRRFFAVTGIPVPRFARRANRRLASTFGGSRSDHSQEVEALLKEVEALRERVDRLETAVYLASIGHRPE